MEQVGGAGASHLTGAGHQKLEELRRNQGSGSNADPGIRATVGTAGQVLEHSNGWLKVGVRTLLER